MTTVTPDIIAAAWSTWHSRHGGKLGPGPAFVEAIEAAMTVKDRIMSEWQSMDTAPLDRDILVDISYWYPDDKTVTACYLVVRWNDESELWESDSEGRSTDQINAWMEIPTTLLPKPKPKERPWCDDEDTILRRLAEGDTIHFSQDGDMAWFTKGDKAFVGDAIMSLREKGYLSRRCDDEENYRGISEYDTISEAGKLYLEGK